MVKKIWAHIRNFFAEDVTVARSTPQSEAMKIYKDVFNMIRDSHSLAHLLNSRKKLREFHTYLVDNKIELWGRQLVIDLNKYWTVKYEYWKRKTRSHQ